ncbi:MAG: 3'-5' exonuclease [Candidatus Vogelbacteria bacterium]|nr:3'-5' exonuclease [Candidatus Vogelbacteria bacterium]
MAEEKQKTSMKHQPLAFIDLETTGLKVEEHEIIEIGCIIANQTQRPGRGAELDFVEEFGIKVRPEHPETAEAEALLINGYRPEDWTDALNLSDAIAILAKKTKGAVMIGQNVTFDWNFLEKAFYDTGIPCEMDYHRLDLMSIAFGRLYDQTSATSFSLRALAEYLGIPHEHPHKALEDIRVTYQVYKKLLDA